LRRRALPALLALVAAGLLVVPRTAFYREYQLRRMSEAQLREWTARRPEDPRGHLYLALARGRTGDTEEAARGLATALALDPALSGARWRLARVLAARGQEEEALALLEQGVRRDPGNPRLHAERGRIHDARGEHRLAAAAWERAVASAPGDADAWYRLGRARMALHEEDRARAAFRRAARVSPRSATYQTALAGALRLQRQYDEAERCYHLALARDARDPDARFGLAKLIWERDGATPPAEEAMRRAVSLQPENPIPRYALGTLCEQRGRLEEAAREYRETLKLLAAGTPPDPADWARREQWLAQLEGPHFKLSLLLERLGKTGEAARHRGAFRRISEVRHRARRLLTRMEASGDPALRAEMARLRASPEWREGAF
jgi:tetratricopeptide (TPR) repeat protein